MKQEDAGIFISVAPSNNFIFRIVNIYPKMVFLPRQIISQFETNDLLQRVDGWFSFSGDDSVVNPLGWFKFLEIYLIFDHPVNFNHTVDHLLQ